MKRRRRRVEVEEEMSKDGGRRRGSKKRDETGRIPRDKSRVEETEGTGQKRITRVITTLINK